MVKVTEMPKTIVWLDPGRVTGIATLEHGKFKSDQCDFQVTGHFVDFLAQKHRSDLLLGWESYLGRGGSPKFAHEVIGVARYLAGKYECQIAEAPASSRVIVTLPVLKALDAHALGKEHANDAARHLVAWLRRENLMKERLDEVFTSLLS